MKTTRVVNDEELFDVEMNLKIAIPWQKLIGRGEWAATFILLCYIPSPRLLSAFHVPVSWQIAYIYIYCIILLCMLINVLRFTYTEHFQNCIFIFKLNFIAR